MSVAEGTNEAQVADAAVLVDDDDDTVLLAGSKAPVEFTRTAAELERVKVELLVVETDDVAEDILAVEMDDVAAETLVDVPMD